MTLFSYHFFFLKFIMLLYSQLFFSQFFYFLHFFDFILISCISNSPLFILSLQSQLIHVTIFPFLKLSLNYELSLFVIIVLSKVSLLSSFNSSLEFYYLEFINFLNAELSYSACLYFSNYS